MSQERSGQRKRMTLGSGPAGGTSTWWALPATPPLWSVLIRAIQMTDVPSTLSSALRDPCPLLSAVHQARFPALRQCLRREQEGQPGSLDVLPCAGCSQGPGTGDRSLAPAFPSHTFSASPAFALLSFFGHTNKCLPTLLCLSGILASAMS